MAERRPDVGERPVRPAQADPRVGVERRGREPQHGDGEERHDHRDQHVEADAPDHPRWTHGVPPAAMVVVKGLCRAQWWYLEAHQTVTPQPPYAAAAARTAVRSRGLP